VTPEFQTLITKHLLTGFDAEYSTQLFMSGKEVVDDLPNGVIFVDGEMLELSALGTYVGEPHNSWLWSWSNQEFDNGPEWLTAAARSVKDYGESNNVPELNAETSSASSDYIGNLYTAIACGVTGAEGALRMQAGEHNSGFYTIQTIPGGFSQKMSHHLHVINKGLTPQFNNVDAISSYLSARGYQLRYGENTLEVTRPGEHAEFFFKADETLDRFDAHSDHEHLANEMSYLAGDPTAQPTKPKETTGLSLPAILFIFTGGLYLFFVFLG